jgi:hypothetical protein
MNRHFKRRFAALLFLCAILTGCEKPQQRTVEVKEETAPPAAASAPAPVPLADTPPAPVAEAKPAPAPTDPLPMEEPIFKIWMAEKEITITGGLKSRIQVDRIVTAMTEAFPEHSIVNELKVETHRYPVGWGNRVADEFLVPYFKEVNSPGVAYQTGVVTLLGEVKSGSRHRTLTEMAVITFSGELTQDIDNKITIAE